MNVDTLEWQEKMQNLHSRSKGISSELQIPYDKLLSKVSIGKTVLDVGCGDMWLKKKLPKGTAYTGMDAFPRVKDVIPYSIEESILPDNSFETITVFATLDGMRDLSKAFSSMKRIASKNILILTGVNIEPDQYHTHKITMDLLMEEMAGWKVGFMEWPHPKIVFIEFTK